MSRRATAIWNLVFHYAAIVFPVVAGVVLVPVYLRHITAETYGYWLATGNLIAWIGLVDPGLAGVLQQQVASAVGGGDGLRVKQLIASAAVMAGILASIAAGVVGMCTLFLPQILGSEDRFASEFMAAFIWAGAGAALSIASYGITAVNLGLQGAVGPGVSYLLAQTIALGSTVVMLNYNWGVVALGLGSFLRGAGLLLGAVAYLVWRARRERLAFRWSKQVFREVVGLSGFTVFGRLAELLMTQVDTLLIVRVLGPEVGTAYALTRKGPEVARMLAQRPGSALAPTVAHLWGEGQLQRTQTIVVGLTRYGILATGMLVTVFLALNSRFVAVWVGKEYFAGNAVNVLIVLCAGISCLTSLLNSLSFAIGDIRRSSLMSFALGIGGVLGMWWAGVTFGAVGVAAGALPALLFVGLGYFPAAVANRLSLGRSFLIKIGTDGIKIVFAISFVVALMPAVNIGNWFGLIVSGLAIVLGYAASCVALFPFFRRDLLVLMRQRGLNACAAL